MRYPYPDHEKKKKKKNKKKKNTGGADPGGAPPPPYPGNFANAGRQVCERSCSEILASYYSEIKVSKCFFC